MHGMSCVNGTMRSILGTTFSSAGTQMQVVAVAWQVYILTHSAIALGLIGLVQAIPRLIFSLVGGVFADVFDRRKMLLIVEVVMASTSAVLALCTIYHVINMFIIYSVVLVSASVSAFEFPTRQAIIPSLVPREQMKDALSLQYGNDATHLYYWPDGRRLRDWLVRRCRYVLD